MSPEEEREYLEYVAAKSRWLRNTAYALAQDWHATDELCQNTLTKLYVHWKKARAADNMDAYVRAIVVHTFLAERRSAWIRRVRLVDEYETTAAPPAADVASTLVLRQAIAKLPTRQRAALVLRYYLDLSVIETAQAMGCSEGNVKSQVSRALAALRAHLHDPEVAPPTGPVEAAPVMRPARKGALS